MQIAMLDLMPLLWAVSILLCAALFFYGDRAAPARTVPAAAAALLLYFLGHPPRLQTAVFSAVYILSAAVYAVVCRLTGRCEEITENFEKPLDSRTDA